MASTETNELQAMVDALRIDGSYDHRTVDFVADEIESRLGIDLPKHSFREMAKSFLQCSLDRNKEERPEIRESKSTHSQRTCSFETEPSPVRATEHIRSEGRSPARTVLPSNTPKSDKRNINSRRGFFTAMKSTSYTNIYEDEMEETKPRTRANPTFPLLFNRSKKQDEKKESEILQEVPTTHLEHGMKQLNVGQGDPGKVNETTGTASQTRSSQSSSAGDLDPTSFFYSAHARSSPLRYDSSFVKPPLSTSKNKERRPCCTDFAQSIPFMQEITISDAPDWASSLRGNPNSPAPSTTPPRRQRPGADMSDPGAESPAQSQSSSKSHTHTSEPLADSATWNDTILASGFSFAPPPSVSRLPPSAFAATATPEETVATPAPQNMEGGFQMGTNSEMKTGIGKKSRKGRTPVVSGSTPIAPLFDPFLATPSPPPAFVGAFSKPTQNEVLQVGTTSGESNSSNAQRPLRRPKISTQQSNGTPHSARSKVFSPMDVDTEESSITSPTLLNIQFNVGTGASSRSRVPTRRRGLPKPSTSLNQVVEEDSGTLPHADHSGFTGLVDSKREEARSYYMNGDYRSSILAYTQAIQAFDQMPAGAQTHSASRNGYAVLLSNRAAAFLMVGGYGAAAADCEKAVAYVSNAADDIDQFSVDGGSPLRVKLLTRWGRALLKLGEHNKASETLDRAIEFANSAIQFCKNSSQSSRLEEVQGVLNHMITEATLGMTDASRLREAQNQVARSLEASIQSPHSRRFHAEALGQVAMALQIANGSVDLQETKVTLLAKMKRWREAAGFCERLASVNVRLDGVFAGDMEANNPFPGAVNATYLSSNYFGDSREEDMTAADLKLNSKAAAEAILRIPLSFTPVYLRSLRLEERYPAADAALKAMEELTRCGFPGMDYIALQEKLSWLPKERSRLHRTKCGRERGDELFRAGDFDLAAAQYATCLSIDSDGLLGQEETNAGGRLHAVLHCNRAACLMALRRYNQALEECSAALRIHSRYMKAMLRRARCYMRLQRYQEAIQEYKLWLELVDEARKVPHGSTGFVTPCVFDGPKDVTDSDISVANSELEGVYIAKRKSETAARQEASRRQERQRWQDNFSNKSWQGNAQQRREHWYNQSDGGPRRWDSFSNTEHRSWHNRSNDWHEKDQQQKDSQSSRGYRRSGSVGSPGSDQSIDHYTVLGIATSATSDEIKKAYRKMALKYHPDKNISNDTTDMFRRAKLAYETLNDPQRRQGYDSKNSFNQRH
jgi:tetratricopeptide (TPR) repeat protein